MIDGNNIIKNFFTNKKVNAEVKFAEHLGMCKNGKGGMSDYHLLKIYEYDDGGKIKNVKLHPLEDFKRPFWTTPKIGQTHEDKREYERIDKLLQHEATQSVVFKEVGRHLRLGKVPERVTRQDALGSQFTYGLNVDAESYIMDWYKRNGKSTPWKVGAFDTESNIEDPHNSSLTHISIAGYDEAYLAVIRERFKNEKYYNNDEVIKEKIKEEYLSSVPDGKNKWESKRRIIEIFEDKETLIETAFKYLHTQNFDIVGIWNMNYDLDVIEREWGELLCRDIRTLFHDPSLPDRFKTYSRNRGRDKIETKLDDGTIKLKTFKPHEIWPSVKTSAGFKFVDAMGLFYQLRSQTPDIEGGFSLNNVTTKILNYGKVRDDSKLTGGKWHIDTSNKRPAFYSAYSMFDSDIMLDLDLKTRDLSSKAIGQLGSAPWSKFNSLPNILHVLFHLSIIRKGYVCGSRSFNDPTDPILGIGKGWIVTVPSYRLDDYTYDITENSILPASIYTHVYDNDEVSAYPFGTSALNISKETTEGELIAMENTTRATALVSNLQLVCNKINTTTYCKDIMGFKGFSSLYEELMI